MPPSSARSVPEPLYSAEAVRRIDRHIIDQRGGDGFGLMQSAAHAAFRRMVKRWPSVSPVLVLCGAGNNGGDGYLLASQAQRHGLEVRCLAVAPVERLTGDARSAWQQAEADGVPVQAVEALDDAGLASLLDGASLIVDAMLGTGVSGPPRSPFAEVIARANACPAPILAVDVPSGLDASTGAAAGEVVRAALTVTFIGRKAGLYTGVGPAVCGDIAFDDLGADADALAAGGVPVARLRRWNDVRALLPRRPANAHKGQFGRLLIVAGDRGFGGAGLMAAEAAGRSGAGLVTLATRPEHVGAALARCPSVMVRGVIHGSEIEDLLSGADTVVCGPGMGTGAWGQQMLQQVLGSEVPRVLDADALNLLASRVAVASERQVLTPHPGEAARLLGCQVADIERDRIGAAQRLQRTYGGVVLLKGAGTVIAAGTETVDIVGGGNPGMATGGMGDVLAGVIGALCGQLSGLAPAVVAAACAHLAAADRASGHVGYMGLLPTDVIGHLPLVFRDAEQAAAADKV
ncbi:NAD(P)H-hydrate dehydratase [Marinobacter sp. C2H3]|uniref:NAD(P)H-hydrate dehydratase n=1 Tax=Marinobacter sp. C2H3 TaxID=3119003 RepID=UPI00300E7ADD